MLTPGKRATLLKEVAARLAVEEWYGMGQDNRLKTAAGLTLLWDGKPVTRIRAADRESVTYYGRRVPLHLQGQPAVLGAFVTDPVLRNQGFLARCLLSVPARRSGRVYESIRPDSLAGLAAFRRWQSSTLARRLPYRIYGDAETDELDPTGIAFDTEAVKLFTLAYNTCQRSIEPGGAMESVREFGGRMPEHAARIAGIFAAVNESPVVTEDHLRGALALVQWHASEWLRAADAAAETESVRQATELLGWLRINDARTLRDVYRAGPRFIRSQSVARRVLGDLASAGYIAWTDKKQSVFTLNSEAA